MKDPSIDLFEMEVAFLKEKMALEIFKGRKIPGEFQLSSVKFHLNGKNVGIHQLIAMINLRHLSCEPDRHDLDEAFPFCPEKVFGDIRSNDPERDEFLSLCYIKGAAVHFGFHSHFFRPDLIDL